MIEQRIIVREFEQAEVDGREALRYAGVRGEDAAARILLSQACEQLLPSIRGLAVYRALEYSSDAELCTLGAATVRSAKLAAAMSGAECVVIFAATVGIEADRIIARQGRSSAALAHMTDALASERIESLCDTLCAALAEELSDEYVLTPRFSAGYGDLPIEFQRELFAMLRPERHIGLTLNGSLLMSPTKSVSAIIGLKRKR